MRGDRGQGSDVVVPISRRRTGSDTRVGLWGGGGRAGFWGLGLTEVVGVCGMAAAVTVDSYTHNRGQQRSRTLSDVNPEVGCVQY